MPFLTKNSSHLHGVVITLISVSVKQELPASAFIDYDRMCCELKMQDQSLQISSSPLRYFQWICKMWEHPTDAESLKTMRNYRSEIVQSLFVWPLYCPVLSGCNRSTAFQATLKSKLIIFFYGILQYLCTQSFFKFMCL